MKTISYEKILSDIKYKLDEMMEKIVATDTLEPIAISINGKYTNKMQSFFQPGWTYSFYMGMIAMIYLHTGEKRYLKYLEDAKETYWRFLYDNTEEIGHDSGFLYSLYAVVMYKITGNVEYKLLALKAADELGKRYQFHAGHMQAFYDMRIRGITDKISLLIVDDMMNMCLLMWAYKETGHSFYRSVYENHILTSINYLIRDDYSVRHAYHFDVATGKSISEMNYCGYAIGSHWARGTAWMIYGLTKALQFTGDKERYLYALEGVTQKYLESLDNPVPLWDFRLPKGEKQYRDSSAAAITSSAFMEFRHIGVKDSLTQKVEELSEAAIAELTSERYYGDNQQEYILKYIENEGSLWGDYFFTELIMKKSYGNKMLDFWI